MSRLDEQEENFSTENVDWPNLEQLNAKVADFLKNRFGYVRYVKEKTDRSIETINLISYFKVEKPTAINLEVRNPDDFINRLESINEEIEKMKDGVGELIEKFPINDRDLGESFKLIYDSIAKLSKVYKKKQKDARIQNDVDRIGELQEIYYSFISEIMEKHLITPVIPALYEGMKGGYVDSNDLFLREINNFLKKIGIFTLDISCGSEIDFTICKPLPDDTAVTTDSELRNKIREIRQLPYAFDDRHIIVPGLVTVWRFQ